MCLLNSNLIITRTIIFHRTQDLYFELRKQQKICWIPPMWMICNCELNFMSWIFVSYKMFRKDIKLLILCFNYFKLSISSNEDCGFLHLHNFLIFFVFFWDFTSISSNFTSFTSNFTSISSFHLH